MAIAIVSGALANKPFNGGEAWVRMSWALGLRRLGFQVVFVEQLDDGQTGDAAAVRHGLERNANLAFFQHVAGQFGLQGSAALIDREGETLWGMPRADLAHWAESAELLLNISGHLSQPRLLRRLGRKVYVDIDPGFTQLWHADPQSHFVIGEHDSYFTIGENIGRPDCPIPTGAIEWRLTRQPVVLDDWPVTPADDQGRFTTVAAWRAPYGPIEWQGGLLGLKCHEFRKLLELPQKLSQTTVTFEIALAIDPADERDRTALCQHGWILVDPREVAGDPTAFRRYVQRSAAEFSVAQGVYVDTNSGWFSDRTVRYLASGKPALVQETGFSRNYPTGQGLVAFRTLEEAVAGAERIASDYPAHCRAARAIAEAFFDSDMVLGRLLDEVGVSP